MCGIVGYIGHRDAWPIIIKGLQRLEYRGYDSAGVALMNGNLNIYKKAGKVSDPNPIGQVKVKTCLEVWLWSILADLHMAKHQTLIRILISLIRTALRVSTP